MQVSYDEVINLLKPICELKPNNDNKDSSVLAGNDSAIEQATASTKTNTNTSIDNLITEIKVLGSIVQRLVGERIALGNNTDVTTTHNNGDCGRTDAKDKTSATQRIDDIDMKLNNVVEDVSEIKSNIEKLIISISGSDTNTNLVTNVPNDNVVGADTPAREQHHSATLGSAPVHRWQHGTSQHTNEPNDAGRTHGTYHYRQQQCDTQQNHINNDLLNRM